MYAQGLPSNESQGRLIHGLVRDYQLISAPPITIETCNVPLHGQFRPVPILRQLSRLATVGVTHHERRISLVYLLQVFSETRQVTACEPMRSVFDEHSPRFHCIGWIDVHEVTFAHVPECCAKIPR